MYLQRWRGWCNMKPPRSRRKFCIHHAPCYFMQNHRRKVHPYLAALLAEWQGLLCVTAVTRGWNGYRNKSQHRKLTLEKKLLLPLLQGFEPATFQSRVRRSNTELSPASTRLRVLNLTHGDQTARSLFCPWLVCARRLPVFSKQSEMLFINGLLRIETWAWYLIHVPTIRYRLPSRHTPQSRHHYKPGTFLSSLLSTHDERGKSEECSSALRHASACSRSVDLQI